MIREDSSLGDIIVSHFDYKHRCLLEKNVPIALILPSRWQDGAESLGIEPTSCLWHKFHSDPGIQILVIEICCLPKFDLRKKIILQAASSFRQLVTAASTTPCTTTPTTEAYLGIPSSRAALRPEYDVPCRECRIEASKAHPV